MRLSVILGLCVVLCGAMMANAGVIPVIMTAGNVTIGCTRTANVVAGYDEVDFYLTGMLGAAAGTYANQPVVVNVIEGRWTADATGAFSVNSSLTSRKTNTTNAKWENTTLPYSAINFESNTGAATIWTNTAGGGGAGTFTGNKTNFFSGSWYSSLNQPYDPLNPDSVSNCLRAPALLNYGGPAADSTFLAALYVTSATPDTGIAFGDTPYSTGAVGKFSFSYGGGTVEQVGFYTQQITPEPGTLVLLAAGLFGLVAYAWRKHR